MSIVLLWPISSYQPAVTELKEVLGDVQNHTLHAVSTALMYSKCISSRPQMIVKCSKTISSDDFGAFITFVFNITYLIVSISFDF